MSAEDDIFDAITRHQIFVLRYAKGREREAELFIARQLEEVIYRLERGNLTAFGRSRAQAQATDLYRYLLASNKEYADQYKADLVKFGEYEAGFNRNMMQKHLKVDLSLPSPMQIQQAAFASLMGLEPSKGYTLGGMLDDFGPAHAQLVMDQIRASIVLGDTTDELIREIRSFAPLQSRKAATLARTAVNHVSVQARKETLKENDDVLLGYEWVATLDSRTSLICMSRDGVIYKDYDNDPKPPAHFNCRSTITPKVNPKYDLGADIVGTRAAKGSGGAGQVSAGLNYDQWLRKQSESFQNKVLGKSRAKLFRKGMTVDKFVDDRGNTYTLRQLAELDTQFNGMTITEAVEELTTEPAEKPFSLAKNFTATSATAEKYQKQLFEQASDKVAKAIKKARVPAITDSSVGGTYDVWERKINSSIDRGNGLTFIHEYGHHIDSTIGRTKRNRDDVRLWVSSTDKGFIDAFEQDRKALGLHRRNTKVATLEQALKEMTEEIIETKIGNRTGKAFTSTKRQNTDPYYSQVQDIFDALTHGYARDVEGFSGHGKSYYKHKENRYNEVFAQLFSLDGAPSHVRAKVAKYFPRLKKRFDEIIEDYIENGVNSYDG